MRCSFTIAELLTATIIGSLAMTTGRAAAQNAQSPPLRLEATIPLGDVAGRIDHMAIDLMRRRLFVAELGNNTIGVVDLDARKVAHVIRGLKEPQGVAFAAPSDTLYAANAGDGSVRLFRGEDYRDIARLDLRDDADNIRVDKAGSQVFVGYGNGALAGFDSANHDRTSDIALKAHPEGFQLDPRGSRVFVNVPAAKEIAVIDRSAGRQTDAWPMRDGGNYPMALDAEAERVLVVFRNPPVLAVFSMRDGAAIARAPACGDADDVFVDPSRHRVYVSCGEGVIDVFEVAEDGYKRLAQIPSAPGARTSLFVPELDRLFVAARASARRPAAILVFKPNT